MNSDYKMLQWWHHHHATSSSVSCCKLCMWFCDTLTALCWTGWLKSLHRWFTLNPLITFTYLRVGPRRQQRTPPWPRVLCPRFWSRAFRTPPGWGICGPRRGWRRTWPRGHAAPPPHSRHHVEGSSSLSEREAKGEGGLQMWVLQSHLLRLFSQKHICGFGLCFDFFFLITIRLNWNLL